MARYEWRGLIARHAASMPQDGGDVHALAAGHLTLSDAQD